MNLRVDMTTDKLTFCVPNMIGLIHKIKDLTFKIINVIRYSVLLKALFSRLTIWIF